MKKLQQSLSSAISTGAGRQHSHAKRLPRFSECGPGPQTCDSGQSKLQFWRTLNHGLAGAAEIRFLGKAMKPGTSLRYHSASKSNAPSVAVMICNTPKCGPSLELAFDSHLCETTIHKQFRSRDIAAVVGCEKYDGLRDLFWFAEPP